MCIIIHKETGVKAPNKSTLKTCWENNPDGAGYAFLREGESKAMARKGFMEFDSFFKALKKDKVQVNDTLIIHFRIGTSGRLDETATHPFPVSRSVTDLRALEYRTTDLLFHNGVLSGGSQSLSDTQEFVRDIVAPLKNVLSDSGVHEVLEHLSSGSRLLLIAGGVALRTGAWDYDKKTKLYFSNTGWKKQPIKTKYSRFTAFTKDYPIDPWEEKHPFRDTHKEAQPGVCPDCLTAEESFFTPVCQCEVCGLVFDPDMPDRDLDYRV